jgi:hypothetical protein
MSEQQFLDRVRAVMESPERRSELAVTYTVGGGAPGESFEERIELSGTGKVAVAVSDDLYRKAVGEASGTVSEEEAAEILESINASLDELVPRSEAEFPPDAIVGSVTFELDGEEQTFYFDASGADSRLLNDADNRLFDATLQSDEPEGPRDTPIDQMVFQLDRLGRRVLGGNDAES